MTKHNDVDYVPSLRKAIKEKEYKIYELEEFMRESNKLQKVRDVSIEKVLDDEIPSEPAQSKLLYQKIIWFKQKISKIEGSLHQINVAKDLKGQAIQKLKKEYKESMIMAKKLRIDVEEETHAKNAADKKAQLDKVKRAHEISMKVSKQSMAALGKKEQQLKKALKVSEQTKTEVLKKIDKVDKELKETVKEIESCDYNIDIDIAHRSSSLNILRNRNTFSIRQNLKLINTQVPKKPFQSSNQIWPHGPKIFLRSFENSHEKPLKDLNYKFQARANRSTPVSSHKTIKNVLKSLNPTQLHISNDIPGNLSSFFLSMEKTSEFKSPSKKQFSNEQDFLPHILDLKLPTMEFSYESPVKHGNKHSNMENTKKRSNLTIILEVDNFQLSKDNFHKEDDS